MRAVKGGAIYPSNKQYLIVAEKCNEEE